MRRLAALLVVALLGCSDDTGTPPVPAEAGVQEAGRVDVAKVNWDGFDPECPLGGPCVLAAAGEGKHKEQMVVIGERLSLTGKNLGEVDAVYLGATPAEIISVAAGQVVCRVPPRALAGSHAIEVKAGTMRRKSAITVMVRRLLALAATDHDRLLTFEATSHNGGPTVTLAALPTAPLRPSASGRFLISRQGEQLLMIDLAAETSRLVSVVGSGESLAGWVTLPDDSVLLAASSNGKLYSVDLGGAAPAAPVAISKAPATVAIARLVEGEPRLLGLHPSASGSEGSVWLAPADLSSFLWAEKDGQPFRIGTGSGLTPLAIAASPGTLGLLVMQAGAPLLAGLTVTGGQLVGVGSIGAPSAFTVEVSSGGGHLLLGTEGAAPSLTFVSVSGSFTLESIALGGGGPSRTLPLPLPSRPSLAAVLVGPKPTTGDLQPAALELVDLAGKSRLLAAGGKPALELPALRDAVGDPLDDKVHLVVGEELQSYAFSISGAVVTLAAKGPHMPLETGKSYRWIAVQP